MGGTHDVAMEVLAEDIGVFALGARRHCLADKWKRLVPVKSAQLDDFSVEGEAVVGKDRFAKPDAAGLLVDDLARTEKPDINRIQLGVLQIPKLDIGQVGE